jgi:hypothetical protein
MQQHKLKKDGKDGRGGHLHQIILLTIDTFKPFCITEQKNQKYINII